jgi:hypothetical protein
VLLNNGLNVTLAFSVHGSRRGSDKAFSDLE